MKFYIYIGWSYNIRLTLCYQLNQFHETNLESWSDSRGITQTLESQIAEASKSYSKWNLKQEVSFI